MDSFAIKCGDWFVNPPMSPVYPLVSGLSNFPYSTWDVKPDARYVQAVASVLRVSESSVKLVKVTFPRGYETEAVDEYRFGRGAYNEEVLV